MSEAKNSTKSGSKSNLNESNMPLLDDEKNEKEVIELKDKEIEAEGKEDGKKEKKKKEKKEKKPKEPKEKKPNIIDTMTVGLNMLERDDKKVNEDVNIAFDDVIAEPDASQGIDGVWRLTYFIFSNVKFWTYRILSAVLALPLALVWALIFAILSFIYIWIITPLLKIFGLFFAVIRKVWVMIIGTTVEPCFEAFGACFSQVKLTHLLERRGNDFLPEMEATRIA